MACRGSRVQFPSAPLLVSPVDDRCHGSLTRLRRWAVLPVDLGDVGPEALELVVVPLLLVEDVDHEVAVVEQDPAQAVEALDPQRGEVRVGLEPAPRPPRRWCAPGGGSSPEAITNQPVIDSTSPTSRTRTSVAFLSSAATGGGLAPRRGGPRGPRPQPAVSPPGRPGVTPPSRARRARSGHRTAGGHRRGRRARRRGCRCSPGRGPPPRRRCRSGWRPSRSVPVPSASSSRWAFSRSALVEEVDDGLAPRRTPRRWR